MGISSVSSLSNLNVPTSTTQNSAPDSAQTSSNSQVANTVESIQSAVAGGNSIALLDALKSIGGSGSANMAALINVAKATTSASTDLSIIGSLQNNGSTVNDVLQSVYNANTNMALYQKIQEVSEDKSTDDSNNTDILQTLTQPVSNNTASSDSDPILDSLLQSGGTSADVNTTNPDISTQPPPTDASNGSDPILDSLLQSDGVAVGAATTDPTVSTQPSSTDTSDAGDPILNSLLQSDGTGTPSQPSSNGSSGSGTDPVLQSLLQSDAAGGQS